MLKMVGADVSKDKFDVCWLRNIETLKKKTKVFKNNPKDHEVLVKWLIKEIGASPEEIVVVLEPTNVYHEQLMHTLYDAGIQVFLVNSGKAKKFAESRNATHKTDKGDAFLLAMYGYSNQNELKKWHPEPQHVRELNLLLRRLAAVEKDLLREKNRKESGEFGLSSKRVIQSLNDIIETLELEIKKLNKDIDNHIKQYPDLKKKERVIRDN